MKPKTKFWRLRPVERKALLAFLSFALLVSVLPDVLSVQTKPQLLHLSLKPLPILEQEPRSYARLASYQSKPKDSLPCPLDPNKADSAQLLQAGFSLPAVKSILRYRQKGGYYQDATQLSYDYRIDLNHLKTLESCLVFAPKPKLNLQTAQIEDLEALPCIGRKTAQRIVEYRTRLGGFIRKEQVRELYGFRDSTWDCIKDLIACEGQNFQKIKLNSVDATTLHRHPYLRGYQARAILEYRQAHQGFKEVQELQLISELHDSTQTALRLMEYCEL